MEKLKVACRFADLFFEAYEISLKDYTILNSSSLFKRMNYKKIDMDYFIEPFLKLFEQIKTADKTCFISIVESFGEFLRIAEKCNYYRNDNSDPIYSEIDEKKTKVALFEDDVLYSISIEKSKVPNITVTPTSSLFFDLNPFEKINNNDYASFITISIDRNYGKGMNNTFKYLFTGAPIFNDKSDEILYNLMKQKVSDCIIKTYDNIISSIFMNSKTIKYRVKEYSHSELILEDIINYGLWINK